MTRSQNLPPEEGRVDAISGPRLTATTMGPQAGCGMRCHCMDGACRQLGGENTAVGIISEVNYVPLYEKASSKQSFRFSLSTVRHNSLTKSSDFSEVNSWIRSISLSV